MSPSRDHSGDRKTTRQSVNKPQRNASGSGIGEYDSGYIFRQRIFMVLVLAMLGLGLWIVATSIEEQGSSQSELLSLSDSRNPYTVLIRELPESKRRLAYQLGQASELKSLA